MHVFRHPKYYKELRERNKSDQAISNPRATAGDGSVRPDPGLKPQAPSDKQQASSNKPKGRDCPDDKNQDLQAASNKPQDLPLKSQ